ncbi:alpha-2-macroglobulin family protein [Neptunicoccus sediminis]|uniref:alpha-2-macroglobulin family protein n=1 Tax=Neptunicoccus sediminis TaxID=1892596 RepID=UPI0008461014|nr:alpha-2-macroglobulin family protein [Neptunicoccus sediminis]
MAFLKVKKLWFGVVLSGLISPHAVTAQTIDHAIPERRIELSDKTDFYGSDIGKIFDVTFKDCAAACLANPACRAFTYNQTSAACFPKSAVGERSAFDGATSAEVHEVAAEDLEFANHQAQRLGFLPDSYLTNAKMVAARNGTWYPTNGRTYDALLAESRKVASEGRLIRALELSIAAANDKDRAESWIEAAQLANQAKPNSAKQRQLVRALRTAGAINGFLRARVPAQQVNALHALASGLESDGQGRQMIPALRLARAIAPRVETQEALDRAISLYGFRIQDHTVDHNAAAPRICAEFSEELVKGTIEYGDFIRSDTQGLVAEADGHQLCIEGVSHGQTHRIAFRQGLPAANGEVLTKTVEMNIYVQDRDPVARFSGRSYLLPKRDGASVPLTTVNLEKVDVKIYRVGDRNLLRSLQEGMFTKPISRWDLDFVANDLGQEVWSGTAEITPELNREVTTALPIGDALRDFKPGVYTMTARVPGIAQDKENTFAAQWFIVSDIGISTLKGNDGIHVFARALGSAEPMGGATVRLVSKANVVLAETQTDQTGHAKFDSGFALGTGGAAPALVTVETSDGDYAFLDQAAAEYDLSDRGVEGRSAPPPIDVFLATDRGAYRPGAVVHTTLLARNHKGEALEGVPVTLDLIRPDGVRHSRKLAGAVGAGGAVTAFELPPNAARGSWKLRAFTDRDAPALLEQRLLVEDFIPEKIDFDLALGAGPFVVTDRPKLDIEARYLFGAVGAGLDIEGEVKLSAASSLDAFPGYEFGAADAVFSTRYETISGAGQTDAHGKRSLQLTLPSVDEVAKPLEMTAHVRLRDGSGRPVERRITAPVLPGRAMIGIKPLFDGTLSEGSEAAFHVVALAADGKARDMEAVNWELNRLHTRYQWYQQYGRWNYEPVTRRERVAAGVVDVTAGNGAQIAAGVEWGAYELKLTHKNAPYAAGSLRFNAGWYASGDGDDTPDLLDVAMDRATYAVGEQATLRVDSRFDGVAQVSVLSGRLIETRAVAVKKGANAFTFDVTEDWGAGAYVTASVLRPMDGGQSPSRALGLAYAPVDPAERLISARFVNPPQADPRGALDVALQLDNLKGGETAYVTLAAVDLGVLNLTGFTTPSPDDHYFGQRKLGVELRDVYGRLISGTGAAGRLRSGGDNQAQAGLQGPPPAEAILAQFSGVLTADPEGMVRHRFDLPDFNGTVRLMAVAWSKTGVGHAEQDVLVRDPVVISLHAPRFLTPGDLSRARLELTHAFGPAGRFEVALNSGTALALGGTPRQSVTLEEGEKLSLNIPLSAQEEGTSEIEVTVKTPDGKTLRKTITMGVQWNDPAIARQTRVSLQSGRALTLDSNTLAGLHGDTVHATLAVGPLARFDAPGLLTALDRYPYGCTEQITSKAMPLLYFDHLSEALGLGDKQQVTQRVEQAITRVLGNQGSNGAFGMWRPASGDLWLDSYVTDFLSRARAQGYRVPDLAFEQALENLRNRVNYAADFEQGGEDIAYALMVLAREGYAAIGDLRYYADTRAAAFATPLAQAQLGSALASYGDQSRADAMFRRAGARLIQQETDTGYRSDYGSGLRDAAAVLSLAIDAKSEVLDRASLAETISRAPVALQSTQESMWSLMAVRALAQQDDAGDVLLDDAPMAAPLVRNLSAEDLQAGITLRNNGSEDALAVVTVFGVPSEPEPAGGNGYKIERMYYTPEGEPVSLDQLRQNDRFVAVLRVTPLRDQEARLIVDDPLPAGLEIDNPNLISGGDIKALDWLDLNATARFAEFRTDRFIAAVDWSGRKPFQLAYLVRAVSPGNFHHPAALVEDMYRPDFRARTASGRVTVAGR